MKPYQRLTPEGKRIFQPRSLYQEGEIEDYSLVVEEKYHGPLGNGQFRGVPKRSSSGSFPRPNPTTQQVKRRPTVNTDQYQRMPSYRYTEKPQGRKKRKNQSMTGYFITIALLLAVIGFSLHVVLDWISDRFIDAQYGNPRTQQVDYVVGHNDSLQFPTHFIALNLRGQVEVIEIPGGDPSKETVYLGPLIVNDKIPVRLSFEDVNNDSKPDMVLHIEDGTNHFTVMMNTGAKFDPKAPVPANAAEKVK